MGTRALFSFFDHPQADDYDVTSEPFNVYTHWDGYPLGAVDKIERAVPLAWEIPRFEPDEFAAAFVAGNKKDPGNVRLMPQGEPLLVAREHCADIEFVYRVTHSRFDADGKTRRIIVMAYAYEGDRLRKLWSGPLSHMRQWAEAFAKGETVKASPVPAVEVDAEVEALKETVRVLQARVTALECGAPIKRKARPNQCG